MSEDLTHQRPCRAPLRQRPAPTPREGGGTYHRYLITAMAKLGKGTRGARVVVVGGGVTGAATAYELAAAGVMVSLVESHALASGATGAAPGVVSMATKKPGLIAGLAQLGAQRLESIAEGLNLRSLHRWGSVLAFEEKAEGELVERRRLELAAQTVRSEMITAQHARRLQPLLRGPLAGAAWFPGDSVVDPRELTHALAGAAKEKAAAVFIGESVLEIEAAGGGVKAVRTTERRLECDWVVNCAGLGAAELAASLGLRHDIRPRRGHLVALAAPASASHVRVTTVPAVFGKQTDSGAGFTGTAVTPVSSDELVIGGSNEAVAPDEAPAAVDALLVATIVLRASRLFPDLGTAAVLRAWSGLRPVAPSGPILGRASGPVGYLSATALGGDGVALAPAVALYVRQAVLKVEPDLDVATFLEGAAYSHRAFHWQRPPAGA
jgi:D-hydroxyproline dehydrogenase subunit beta